MDGMLSEIRFALRHLARSPSFSILVILTLALGIGATTAIFSVVNGVLLNDLPYPDADRMLRVRTHFQGRIGNSSAAANFHDYREQIESIDSVTFYQYQRWYLGDTTEPRFPLGVEVSHEFFDVAGIKPVLGRGFGPDDERSDTDVVVISHGLWQSHFGGRSDVVGQKLTLDGRPYTVIGVTAAEFGFPNNQVEVWRPLWFDVTATGFRTDHLYSVIARVADGVPIEDAQAEFSAYGERVIREYPENYKGFQYGVSAVSLLESGVGSVRTPLFILMAAVTFVLLIAVVNVANLFLVRIETRSHELAVRTALGASRRRIKRHLVTECMLLSVAGGAVGLFFATLGTRTLLVFAQDSLPRTDNVSIDLRVLFLVVVVSIGAGLLAAILPATRISGVRGSKALQSSSRTIVGGGRSKLRYSLVVAEIALAVILVVGAGLMLRTLSELTRVDVGFRTENIIATRISLPESVYPSGPQIGDYYESVVEQVAAIPGVTSSGVVSRLPLASGFATYSIQIEGQEVETIGESPHTYLQFTSPGYFQALNLAAIRGRLHDDGDSAGQPLTVLVNEAFVRELLDDKRVIGRRVKRWGEKQLWAEIIGVVPDIQQRDLERETYPCMYVNHRQVAVETLSSDSFELRYARRMWLVVHTERDAASFTEPVRQLLRQIGPSVPIGDFQTMAAIRADSAASREFPTVLLVVFSCIALSLAVVGVYGVVAFAANRRTSEIGIRMALGARPVEVRRLVVKHGLAPVVIGVVIGMMGAAVVSRTLQSLLYNVQPMDAVTLFVVPWLIVAAALVACFIPALRASRIDPSAVLRSE
jgi:putative ABC transport system permease protein